MAYDRYPAIDADYKFPPPVVDALSNEPVIRNGAIPMTTTERAALTGPELWDGRIISNISTGHLNRWNATTASWQVLVDENNPGITTACTSTTRPSHSPGRLIFETDTSLTQMSDGTRWKPIGGGAMSLQKDALIPSLAAGLMPQGLLTRAADAHFTVPNNPNVSTAFVQFDLRLSAPANAAATAWLNAVAGVAVNIDVSRAHNHTDAAGWDLTTHMSGFLTITPAMLGTDLNIWVDVQPDGGGVGCLIGQGYMRVDWLRGM